MWRVPEATARQGSTAGQLRHRRGGTEGRRDVVKEAGSR